MSSTTRSSRVSGARDSDAGDRPRRPSARCRRPRPASAGAWNAGDAVNRPEGFHSSVERLSPKLRQRMDGSSWHQGCPVGLGRLRLLRVSHWDFRGRVQSGQLVVNERYAAGMADVFARLFAKRFPIRRMELIDHYGADDHRSMARQHLRLQLPVRQRYERLVDARLRKAVDINPRENPYVSGDFVSPPEGRPYADRRDHRKGMILGPWSSGRRVRAPDRMGVGWPLERSNRLPAHVFERQLSLPEQRHRASLRVAGRLDRRRRRRHGIARGIPTGSLDRGRRQAGAARLVRSRLQRRREPVQPGGAAGGIAQRLPPALVPERLCGRSGGRGRL